jgi:hypothetical protein
MAPERAKLTVMRTLSSLSWIFRFISVGAILSRKVSLSNEYDENLYRNFLRECSKSSTGYINEQLYMEMYSNGFNKSIGGRYFSKKNDILHVVNFDDGEVFIRSLKKYDVVDVLMAMMVTGELILRANLTETLVLSVLFVVMKVYHLFEFFKEHSEFILNLKYNLEIFKKS